MNRTNLSIFESLSDFLLQGTQHRDRYCRSPKDFSRRRKFGFEVTALMVLRLLQKSLALELREFFGHLGGGRGHQVGIQ